MFVHREALLAEMGVAVREDGGAADVFSPKKVRTLKKPDLWTVISFTTTVIYQPHNIYHKALQYLQEAPTCVYWHGWTFFPERGV